MEKKNKINRRHWLRLGFGATLGTLSLKIFGCSDASSPQEAASETNKTAESCLPTQYETMGPFHPNKDQADKDLDLTTFNGSSERAAGEVIYIRGKVTDQSCNPIPNALVMIWHANTHGKYTHEYDTNQVEEDPYFQGWGQVKTDEKGEYGFKTIKPGAYVFDQDKNDWRAPHVHFKVARRGYHQLITQMYFEGEALNEEDVFASELNDQEKRQVIRPMVKEAEGIEKDASLVNFDIALKSVRPKEKDVAGIDQLIGDYTVNFKSTPLEQELIDFFGGAREELTISITKEEGLLFAEMPVQPKCEIYRKSKDRYEYRAFEADIAFNRNDQNEVIGLTFHRHFDFPDITADKR